MLGFGEEANLAVGEAAVRPCDARLMVLLKALDLNPTSALSQCR
jgi:hypothetical protein